jgi:hypothetical protein
MVFTDAVPSWSGHFFNFDDMTSQLPWKFHALAGPAGSPSNAQLYQQNLGDGPIDAMITCRAHGY